MFDLINEVEAQGILPTKWLREAANDDIIFTERYKIPEGNLQPATFGPPPGRDRPPASLQLSARTPVRWRRSWSIWKWRR